ncbi:hypothetical protein [Hymenobacter metallicola]|uniref:Uncharacterized protein n=1 Tax=Hymenobacter metallicola TaxID=2563114 RepID=A0A4Z0Q3A6_9BACT|nr:hypothetical protein [Hymenobacter metallicola]TGE23212.1 hypothetical protein E5K02_18595 [Hymenobacter metallicola]
MAILFVPVMLGKTMLVVFPLWKLHQLVKQNVSSPDNAFPTATQWWLVSYIALCLWFTYLIAEGEQGWQRRFIAQIDWLQYPLAAALTFPVAVLAFYLKRWCYRFLERDQ